MTFLFETAAARRGSIAPLLQRFVIGVVLPLVLSFCVPAAHAGTYQVTYTGGPAVNHVDGSSISSAYGPDNTGEYGITGYIGCIWGTKSVPNGGSVAFSGDANADTVITAHFVWNPAYAGEPPPKNAIVYQKASATFSQNNTSGQGDCTSGLPHEISFPLRRSYMGPLIGYLKTGYKYEVKVDPGQAFDVPCSTAAHLSGEGSVGPPIISGGGSVTVKYLAQAAPVEINFTGTLRLPNGSTDLIMTGQGLRSTLSCGICRSIRSWSWSASAGKPFSGWYADEHETYYFPLQAEDKRRETFHVYFTEKATDTEIIISCTATATLPDDTECQITAERKVSLLVPIVLLNRPTPGRVLIDKAAKRITTTGPSDAPSGSDDEHNGMTWRGSYDTPTDFKNAQGNGSWHFVQTISFGRWYTPEGGSETPAANGVGLWGLDTKYAYSHPLPNSYSSRGYPADGLEYTNHDSPSEPLGDDNIAHRIQEPFETWVMFAPPPANASNPDFMWIPMWKYEWHWQGQATRPTAHPPTDWTGGGLVKLDSTTVTDIYPEWLFKLVQGNVVF